MLRALSSAMIAELGLTGTRPGYLIEIAWTPGMVSRLATFADLTVLGFDWTLTDVLVTELSEDIKGKSSAGLTFGDSDNTWSALALGTKFADVPIRIWEVYAGATADADAVLRFSGVGDGSKIAPNGQVQVTLTTAGSGTMFCPRDVLGPETGFNHLPEAGIINYGGQQYQLQPGQQ